MSTGKLGRSRRRWRRSEGGRAHQGRVDVREMTNAWRLWCTMEEVLYDSTGWDAMQD